MTEFVEPRVTLIAKTDFVRDNIGGDSVTWAWTTDAKSSGDALAEFAGRACYQSWKKPNVFTATNYSYLRHILEVGHLSVLEHASATFYIEGVSRSLTHELIRHRHLSFSQLSQRYVNESGAAMVRPPGIAAYSTEESDLIRSIGHAMDAYDTIADRLGRIADEPDRTKRRKMAREAARSVLPNATETKIVVTGNYRAWRHFIRLRATEAADAEIRRLAVMLLRELQREAPAAFQDFEILTRVGEGWQYAQTDNTAG